MMDRRGWLYNMGLLAGAAAKPGIFASGESTDAADGAVSQRKPLDISEYAPKSMLRVQETMVPRAKFPVIDIHTHLSGSKRYE
ncbi:MAG: hypothetical protein ABLQ96_03800, partial [Candidatus Acidiferrum sp.]